MAHSDSHSDADRRTITRSSSRRRFLAAAGAAGITTTVAGCLSGGDDDGSAAPDERPEYDGEEVTVEWSTAPLFGNEEEQLKQALSDAGLHENITVNFTTTVWGADDLQDRYNQILSAGRSTPDFMLTNFSYTAAFAPRGWLMDLTNVLTDEKHDQLENDYHQTMVDSMRWDDGIYGVPLFVDIPTILYRKDLVEQAGYDPEGQNWATEPMTWSRFSEIVSDAQQQHGTDHGYTTTLNQRTIGHQTGYEKIVTYGGNYFGDMSNQHGPIGDRPITVDDEQVVQALRVMRTMMHGQSDEYAVDGISGNILPSDALGWDTTPSTESFSAGEAIAHRNWSYAIADFGGEDGFGEDLGLMPFPYGVTEEEAEYEGTGGTNATLGGWHLSVNPNTEKLAATLEVIDAMTSDEFYLRIFELTGSTPPKPNLYQSDRAQDVDVMNRYLDTLQLQSQNQWVHPINQVWDLQRQPISEQFHACLQQDTSPQDAVATAQEEVEAIEDQHA